jgi:hypothetical protein
MNATQPRVIPEHLRVVLTLSHVLQQLEWSTVPVGADQYRSVVSHLSEELGTLPTDADLQAVLDAYPATAELYENLNYRHAGLCRSPLDDSLAAEIKAKEAIDHARGAAPDPFAH